MPQIAVGLGSALAVITYPPALSPWFNGLPNVTGLAPAKLFGLLPDAGPGRYQVSVGNEGPIQDLSAGDALATLWEKVGFHLVADLDDAFALHAAALSRPTGEVLLPGKSGAGKTHLALWYRRQGYELGTDEIVTVTPVPEGSNNALATSALARPVILKNVLNADTLLLPEEQSAVVQAASASGLIVRPQGRRDWTRRLFDRTFIVFPHYRTGASLSLTVLTAAQTGLRLIENCVNWRNLPEGLSLASAIARRALAVDLVYGDTMQLGGCLDAVTSQALAANPSREHLAVICAPFAAKPAVGW